MKIYLYKIFHSRGKTWPQISIKSSLKTFFLRFLKNQAKKTKFFLKVTPNSLMKEKKQVN